MHIMGWDVDIVHRANNYLTDADCWSRLDSNLCYDLTFKDYIWLVSTLQSQSMSPSDLPILPRNMPYYRSPQIKATPPTLDAEDEIHQTLLADSIHHPHLDIPPHVSNCPEFNLEILSNLFLPIPVTVCGITTSSQHMHFLFHNLPGQSILSTPVIFASLISTCNLPFNVTLACNPFAYGYMLMEEFMSCKCIVFSSATALLDHIQGLGNQSTSNGYMVHSHWFQSSKPISTFGALQTSIFTQLHTIHSLSLFVAFVHPDHDSHSILHFSNDLSCTGWVTSSRRLDYTNYGDTVVGHTTVIVGIHNSTESLVEKFQFKTPPRKLPLCLNSFLWWNFNKVEYGISYGHENDDFGCWGYIIS